MLNERHDFTSIFRSKDIFFQRTARLLLFLAYIIGHLGSAAFFSDHTHHSVGEGKPGVAAPFENAIGASAGCSNANQTSVINSSTNQSVPSNCGPAKAAAGSTLLLNRIAVGTAATTFIIAGASEFVFLLSSLSAKLRGWILGARSLDQLELLFPACRVEMSEIFRFLKNTVRSGRRRRHAYNTGSSCTCGQHRVISTLQVRGRPARRTIVRPVLCHIDSLTI